MEDTQRQQPSLIAIRTSKEYVDMHVVRITLWALRQPLLVPVAFRFYGFTENQRERDMDMREMVDKVKKNEPLYGTSQLSPHMQGVAARNSRYAGVWLHIIPWFNFVNHEQHGIDTAKYYQQAERELEAERTKTA
ncbi:MAG: hypothetical protein Q9170_003963 [Blastenia crenularia]